MKNAAGEIVAYCNDAGDWIAETGSEAMEYIWNTLDDLIIWAKQSGKSQKERATEIPSWAKGEKPEEGESGKDFAKRVCDERFGPGNYKTGPGSDYNKLKKYGDRNF